MDGPSPAICFSAKNSCTVAVQLPIALLCVYTDEQARLPLGEKVKLAKGLRPFSFGSC
ncbi:hypothetical protein WN55_10003 [Dufourea novaeangliae]|uniref:Uncharacterized protein n=1 Tax=Dufourea novaeangliae TaxID=178035 RepID=A0A154P8D7_DUFNO|nr:hypothetical protein WN55_10003 [Dufourea novaeangliae]